MYGCFFFSSLIFIYLAPPGLSCVLWDLWLWCVGSRVTSGVTVHWHVRSWSPSQGLNRRPLHGEADSQLPDYGGSPYMATLNQCFHSGPLLPPREYLAVS